jgi:3-dehydroquinate synthase
MTTLETEVIAPDGSYPVRVGDDLDALVGGLASRFAGVTIVAALDSRVEELHGDRIRRALERLDRTTRYVSISAGESSKSLRQYAALCSALHASRIDRRGLVVAAGGGVTTDLVGFASATYMRGLRWLAVPTTLLGMVDAAIGGKTGVNFRGAKNVLGAFHRPEAVLADVRFLDTLDAREYRSGLAEVVKAAVIGDAGLLSVLESAGRELAGREVHTLLPVIHRAAAVKAQVVGQDERERGRRAILNFGHTIGHALESATRFRKWRHGEAVAIGMACAAELSVAIAGLPEADRERIIAALRSLGLPTEDHETKAADLVPWLYRDKKIEAGAPRFVLTPRIGSASFGHLVPQLSVIQTLARFFSGTAR